MKNILFVIMAVMGSLATAQEPFPKSDPPYYRVRYEKSDEAGELPFAVSYTIWIPPDIPTLRGIVVHQHGCGEGACRAGRTAAFDLHWQALARKNQCALLGPSYEQPQSAVCDLWCDPRNGSEKKFLQALAELAKLSNHPELENVPWALWGHSGGAAWVGTLLMLRPERIACVWLRSGSPRVMQREGLTLPPVTIPEASLLVPVMSNQGTQEGVTVTEGRFTSVWTTTQQFFKDFRGRGGLIGVAVDPLSSHDCGNQRYLAIPWMDACMAARLPEQAGDPLKPMPTKPAWLAEFHTGMPQPAAQYPGDPTKALWLPNAEIAIAWSEYVKDSNVSDSTPPPSPTHVRVHADGTIQWQAEADFESGIGSFIVQRDNQDIATIPEKPVGNFGRRIFQNNSYSDTPAEPLLEMRFVASDYKIDEKHAYRVVSVNSVGLKSEPSEIATPLVVDNHIQLPKKSTFTYRAHLIGADTRPCVGAKIEMGIRSSRTDQATSLDSSEIGLPLNDVVAKHSTTTDENGNFEIPKTPLNVAIVLKATLPGESKSSWLANRRFVSEKNDLPDVLRCRSKPKTVAEAQRTLKSIMSSLQRLCQIDNRAGLVVISGGSEKASRFIQSQFVDSDRLPELDAYLLQVIDGPKLATLPENQANFSKRQWPIPEGDVLFLAALDSAGKELGSIPLDISNSQEAAIEFAEFVKTYTPPPRDARMQFEAALADAKQSNRCLFVYSVQPNCGSCQAFGRWFDSHRETIQKYYVLFQFEPSRDQGGLELEKALGLQNLESPAYVILDSDGRVLIDSIGPIGNIGYPAGDPEGIQYFRKMLTATATNLTNDEIESMVRSLTDEAALNHLLAGNLHFEKDLDTAIAHWRMAVESNPHLEAALNNLAVGLARKSPPEFEEALKLIDRALEKPTTQPEILDSKAEILERAHRYQEAIVACEVALKAEPNRLGTYKRLLRCYDQLQMTDEAQAIQTVINRLQKEGSPSR